VHDDADRPAPTPPPTPPPGPAARARLADTLREAFHVLQEADLDVAERQRWQRRLIAITDAAKHDVQRAEVRIERFRLDFSRAVTGPRDVEDR
jgi:hypothetical protein